MTELTVAQSRIYRDNSRFRVCIAGRRFGKTFLALQEIWRAATKARKQNVMYAAPTYGQARDIMWDAIVDMIPRTLLSGDPNISRMEIRLINGSKIRVRGTHNADTLRGQGLDFVVLDEFGYMEEGVWTKVLRPMLADRKGTGLFIGSPVGFNWSYDLWNQEKKYDEWNSFQFTTLQGGQVDLDEVQKASETLPRKVFEQEYLASFMSLQGRVYYAFDINTHLDETIKFDKKKPILLGVDFNVSPYCAVAAQIRYREAGGKRIKELVILDEFKLTDSNTPEFISEVKNRYGKHQIICYPDASGKSRHTSSHQTDHQMLFNAGFDIASPKANPYVADRINETNALFTNHKGDHRLWIHPNCTYLKDCLLGHTYKENTSIPDKSQNLDHILDATGYLVHGVFPIGGFKAMATSLNL